MAATKANLFDITKFNLTDPRKDLVFLARVSETAERYEDMCQFVRALVKAIDTKSDLTVEERNLLSVAFKNVVGARRAAWRTLNVEEHKDNPLIQTYRKQIDAELESVCQDVLDLLQKVLIPNTKATKSEASVFYLKMAGDYFRYLAEFIENKDYANQAADHYEQATVIANEKLAPTHPIRLGLALNYSVCNYEILKDHKKACDMAKRAFDDAISKLDQLDEASYKDSTLIMQLLRDNLTLWTSDNNDADPNEEPDK